MSSYRQAMTIDEAISVHVLVLISHGIPYMCIKQDWHKQESTLLTRPRIKQLPPPMR